MTPIFSLSVLVLTMKLHNGQLLCPTGSAMGSPTVSEELLPIYVLVDEQTFTLWTTVQDLQQECSCGDLRFPSQLEGIILNISIPKF